MNRVFHWKKNKEGEWFVVNDGYHANQNGEYLDGLVWYASIFDEDPRNISFKPEALTEEQASSLRKVAFDTVSPDKIDGQYYERMIKRKKWPLEKYRFFHFRFDRNFWTASSAVFNLGGCKSPDFDNII